MKNDFKDIKFQKLLDKLQQESWQLELLISGFAIFGLFSALEPLDFLYQEAVASESYTKYFYIVAGISCKVLIINLVIHVILRGLWIGAIGLRYVSGEIEYDTLNYKKRFTNYLEKKVGSFDRYIGNLENYCSILFAVSFLYLFYIISFFLVFSVILLAGAFFIESGILSEFTGTFLLGIFSICYLLLACIIFLDFATLGYLKKVEWTSFLYFPIYKLFSVITLSFLYRPLVYNFLDNKFGRRLLLILLPIYISAFYLSTVSNVRSNFIYKESYSSAYYTNSTNYLNSLQKGDYIRQAAIQSKVISTPYLNVFIPFRKKIEEIVYLQDSVLNLKDDKRGFRSSFFKLEKNTSRRDSLKTNYLKAFKKAYLISLDTTLINAEFLITKTNNQLGFETILPLKNIKEGKHLLKISRFIKSEKTKQIEKENVIEIPFWYYKQ